MNKHNPMYPDFSPVVADTFKLLEGHVMRDHWYESEEVFVVPPHNEIHIVVSHNSNGQYYTSIRDYTVTAGQSSGFKHRCGSAESHRSWKAAFERAKAVWEHETETEASRLETKAPSPGLSSEAAQGAPVVSQPQAESASAPAPHHSGAPPQGARIRMLEQKIMRLEARVQGYEEDIIRVSGELASAREEFVAAEKTK